jgi:hypothetical protein
MSIDPEISCPPIRTKLSAHPDFFMSAGSCVARVRWSSPRPARRRSWPCTSCCRRRTDASARTEPPVLPRWAGQPPDGDSGYELGPTRLRTIDRRPRSTWRMPRPARPTELVRSSRPPRRPSAVTGQLIDHNRTRIMITDLRDHGLGGLRDVDHAISDRTISTSALTTAMRARGGAGEGENWES